jgi:hypothetical protein
MGLKRPFPAGSVGPSLVASQTNCFYVMPSSKQVKKRTRSFVFMLPTSVLAKQAGSVSQRCSFFVSPCGFASPRPGSVPWTMSLYLHLLYHGSQVFQPDNA